MAIDYLSGTSAVQGLSLCLLLAKHTLLSGKWKKTTPGFIYMVITPYSTHCSLPGANHMVKSGPVCWRMEQSKLSLSWAVGTVGWAHAFFGCQERQPRLGDERITSVLKGTEWLILLQPLDTQSLKLSHFLPPGTNNTFPTYNNFCRITMQISLHTMETSEHNVKLDDTITTCMSSEMSSVNFKFETLSPPFAQPSLI